MLEFFHIMDTKYSSVGKLIFFVFFDMMLMRNDSSFTNEHKNHSTANRVVFFYVRCDLERVG